MAKKTAVKGGKAVKAAAGKAMAQPGGEKPKGNYLVVRATRDLRRGQTVTILEFAETEEKARKWVDALTDSSPAFLAIMEKKTVLERKPQMVVSEVADHA